MAVVWIMPRPGIVRGDVGRYEVLYEKLDDG